MVYQGLTSHSTQRDVALLSVNVIRYWACMLSITRELHFRLCTVTTSGVIHALDVYLFEEKQTACLRIASGSGQSCKICSVVTCIKISSSWRRKGDNNGSLCSYCPCPGLLLVVSCDLYCLGLIAFFFIASCKQLFSFFSCSSISYIFYAASA